MSETSLVNEYLTVEEANKIIESCNNPRDKLILKTMWETGGRVSEVLGLIPENIDELNNCIYLINLKQKKNKAELKRVFLFSDSTLCKDLMAYCKENGIMKGQWVFKGGVTKHGKEGQVSTVYIWYLLSSTEDGRKPGLATMSNINKAKGGRRKPAWPHLFRHGAAMNIYRRTGRLDVTQKELGHSTIGTTEIYAQLMDTDRKEIIDKC